MVWETKFQGIAIKRTILKLKVESMSHEANKVGEATTRLPRLEGWVLLYFTKAEGTLKL